MAKVVAKDREKTGFSDGAYPVNSMGQAMSALKLRHSSDKHFKD